MNGRSSFIVATLLLTAVTVARSGHEMPIYPSYYPHEIGLVAVTPEQAADLLLSGMIHAYVGRAPRFAGPPPDTVGYVESLGSFVVVRVNPTSPRAKDARSACAAVDAIFRDLAGKTAGFVFHPYPVTPLHGDYLNHFDLAENAKANILGVRPGSSADPNGKLRVKAGSERMRAIVSAEWRTQDSEWDAEVSEVDVASLIASASFSMNGWRGPAWMRNGWFHAYLLLGDQFGDEEKKRSIQTLLQRLQSAAHNSAAERTNLERSLVAALMEGCRTVVAGYALKREYFNAGFSSGIENIAYDSLEGLNSPISIRTMKLKDFPWNGWLALGIDGLPGSAWNPIAGFTDDFGRLMWSAVGDPALIPSPYESVWMLNRITDVQSSTRQ